MKMILGGLVLILVLGAQAQWFKISRKAVRFTKESVQGSHGMWQTYSDMERKSDKYFHAQGTYDDAKRAPEKRWAAKAISNALQLLPGSSGRGHKDSATDQRAKRWAHTGEDPNNHRHKALLTKY